MDEMKKGNTVTTPHGKGIIVDLEKFRLTERVGVKLDQNPFRFPIAYFFKHEIKEIKP